MGKENRDRDGVGVIESEPIFNRIIQRTLNATVLEMDFTILGLVAKTISDTDNHDVYMRDSRNL
jgi:hypothetical protein